MEKFVDRERETKAIIEFVYKSPNQVLHITGLHGVGKTAIVKETIKKLNQKSIYINSYLDEKIEDYFNMDNTYLPKDYFYYMFFVEKIPSEMQLEESFIDIMRRLIEEDVSLLIIDDAHFLSEYGSQFITYAALTEEIKIIIITRKDLYEKSNIKKVVDRIRRENLLSEMEISPIGEDVIVKIFKEYFESGVSPDYLKWLKEFSNGNIHFIKFLVKGDIHPEIKVPEKIREMYEMLDENERKILGYLSLVRKPIPLEAFLDLTSVDENDLLFLLDELSEGGWIYEEDGSFAVCASEIAKCAYESLDEKTRKYLHRKLAEYYLSVNDLRSALYHFSLCDKEKYIETLEKCAQDALNKYSFSEAETYYKKLYELTGRKKYLENLLEILLFSSKNKEFEYWIKFAPEEGMFNILRAVYYIRTGDIKTAMQYSVECSKDNDERIRIMGNMWTAYIFRVMGLEEIAKEILEKTLEQSEKRGYWEGVVYSRIYLGLSKYNLGDKSGIDDLRKSLELSRGSRLEYLAGVNLTDVLIAENNLGEAESILTELLKKAREHHLGFEEKLLIMNFAYLLAKKNHIKEAIEDFIELQKYFEERNYGFLLVQVYIRLGDCYLWANDLYKAMKYYRKSLESAMEYGYPSLIKTAYNKIKTLENKLKGEKR